MEKEDLIVFVIIAMFALSFAWVLFSGGSPETVINNSSEENPNENTENKKEILSEEERISKSENFNLTENRKNKEVIKNYLKDFEEEGRNLSKYVHPNSPDYSDISLSNNYGIEEDLLREFREDILIENISITFNGTGGDGLAYYKIQLSQDFKSSSDAIAGRSEIEDNFTMKKYDGEWRIWEVKEFIR